MHVMFQKIQDLILNWIKKNNFDNNIPLTVKSFVRGKEQVCFFQTICPSPAVLDVKGQ